MSIKIYDGKQLGSMSILELHQWQRGLREKLSAKAHELYAQAMVDCMTKLIHYACLHTEYELTKYIEREFSEEKFDSDDSASSIAFWGLFRQSRKAMSSEKRDWRIDYLDYKAKLIVFPIHNKLLALFFAEQSEFHDIWESYPRVSDYGFGTSTDKPSRLSTKEWKRRESDWGKAFKKFRGAPLDNGLVYELVWEPPHIMPRDVEHLFKTFEERLTDVAYNRLHNRLFREELAKLPKDEDDRDGFSHRLRLVKASEKRIKTEEGQLLLSQERDAISSKIPTIIDKEVLSRPLREFCIPSEWSGWEL